MGIEDLCHSRDGLAEVDGGREQGLERLLEGHVEWLGRGGELAVSLEWVRALNVDTADRLLWGLDEGDHLDVLVRGPP